MARAGLVVDRRPGQLPGVVREPREQGRVERLREHVHRNVDQHRAGLAALGQQERLLDDLGQELGLLDPPGSLHEGPVDLVLRGVGVQVDLLVGVPAEVVRRHVTRDHHHRDAVERGVGHPGGGVGQAGAEVAQHDARPSGHPGVAVGGVRSDLLVAHVHELDVAVRHGGQYGDVRVTAQPEHVANAAPLQVPDELLGGGRWRRHAWSSQRSGSPGAVDGEAPTTGDSSRWSGPW